MNESDDDRIPTHRLAAFALPAFSLSALGLPIVAILPPLYAEHGLSLTVVGTVFMLTRVFDVITDPLFGFLGDKFNAPWGRRRVAIMVGTPILIVGVYRVFFPALPVSSSSLLVSLLILYVGWTMLTLAHTAWASELSSDYDERSRIMGAIHIVGLIGAVVILLAPAIVDFVHDAPDMKMRGEMMGYIVLISLPIFVLISSGSVSDRATSTSRQPHWRSAIRAFVSNKPLRRLLAADFLMGFQGGINGSVHFFYVAHVLQLPKSGSLFLIFIFISGLLCVPLFIKLSYRIGKHRTLCCGAAMSSISTATLFFLPAAAFWLALIVFVTIGFMIGARDFLMRSMMADIIDEDRLETGTERGALFYSMLTLTAKLGAAFAVGLTYPVLDWVGFDPGAVNDSGILDGVRLVVSASPTLVTISVVLIMWKFPLDKKRQQQTQSVLRTSQNNGTDQLH